MNFKHVVPSLFSFLSLLASTFAQGIDPFTNDPNNPPVPGQPYVITWTPTSGTGDVILLLNWFDATVTIAIDYYTYLSYSTPNNGSFLWNVPADLTGKHSFSIALTFEDPISFSDPFNIPIPPTSTPPPPSTTSAWYATYTIGESNSFDGLPTTPTTLCIYSPGASFSLCGVYVEPSTTSVAPTVASATAVVPNTTGTSSISTLTSIQKPIITSGLASTSTPPTMSMLTSTSISTLISTSSTNYATVVSLSSCAGSQLAPQPTSITDNMGMTTFFSPLGCGTGPTASINAHPQVSCQSDFTMQEAASLTTYCCPPSWNFWTFTSAATTVGVWCESTLGAAPSSRAIKREYPGAFAVTDVVKRQVGSDSATSSAGSSITTISNAIFVAAGTMAATVSSSTSVISSTITSSQAPSSTTNTSSATSITAATSSSGTAAASSTKAISTSGTNARSANTRTMFCTCAILLVLGALGAMICS